MSQKVPEFVKNQEKSSIWPKTWTFSNKLPCFCALGNFSAKSSKKSLISRKSTKNCQFGQNFQLFDPDYYVSAFLWSFKQKVAKSASFREKARKIVELAKNYQIFEHTAIFEAFGELFSKKCLICRGSTKNRRFGQKLATFRPNYHVLTFRRAFLAKSCKKCLISWKSTKHRRFGQKLSFFQAKYHVLRFWWIFQQKVEKTAWFREKARKIVNLAKNLQLFEQTTMFRRFDELFGKEVKKVPHFVKKHKTSLIWQKTRNFLNRLPCLCVFTNFSAKSAWLREKARKIVDLAERLQLFQQTIIIGRFGKFFSKKLPKVPHFVKKHEKSSIWPKTCNFSNKLPCFGVSTNFSAKRWKKCLIS